MKKRLFALILISVMAFSVTACTSGSTGGDHASEETSSDSEVAEDDNGGDEEVEEETIEGEQLTYMDKVAITYPDSWTFDEQWDEIEKDGISIAIRTQATSYDDWKETFSGDDYASTDNYELTEVTVAGYPALKCVYSDASFGEPRIRYEIDITSALDDANAKTAQIQINFESEDGLSDESVQDIVDSFEVLS